MEAEHCHVTRTIQRWATTTKTVLYRYSKAGRLDTVGLDGGAEATYRYDADGSVTGIAVTPAGGARGDLVTSVAYRPFDLIESWRYGNGSELRAARDKSGRVTTWSGIDPDNSVYVLGYTPGGEIESQFGRWYGFGLGHDGLGYLDAVKDFDIGIYGAAATGGIANVGVYLANGGDIGDAGGVAWAAGTGGAGGAIGGSFKHASPHGYNGTAASRAMVDRSNMNTTLRLNTGSSNFVRSASGAMPGNVPNGSGVPCGCDH